MSMPNIRRSNKNKNKKYYKSKVSRYLSCYWGHDLWYIYIMSIIMKQHDYFWNPRLFQTLIFTFLNCKCHLKFRLMKHPLKFPIIKKLKNLIRFIELTVMIWGLISPSLIKLCMQENLVDYRDSHLVRGEHINVN